MPVVDTAFKSLSEEEDFTARYTALLDPAWSVGALLEHELADAASVALSAIPRSPNRSAGQGN